MIRCLFWNINRKNLVQELYNMVLENDIDIVMLVEAENLDVQHFISRLKECGRNFEKKEILSRQREIILLAEAKFKVAIYKEEKYFAAYKVRKGGKNLLLVTVHFTSAMFRSELARNQRANDLSRAIEKLEEVCNTEALSAGEKTYSTIVAGDFNLQPFSTGIIGMHGFHAIMDSEKAMKGYRGGNGSEVKFFYNPTWSLFGRRDHALGTYYFDSDQDDNLFYWYMFDQVLIRPELIEAFVWEEFEVIDHIGEDSLIRNHRIYKKKYSDHLPIKFAIR